MERAPDSKRAVLTTAAPKIAKPAAAIPAEVKKAVDEPRVNAKELPPLMDKAPRVKTPVEASKVALALAMAIATMVTKAKLFMVMLKSVRRKEGINNKFLQVKFNFRQ